MVKWRSEKGQWNGLMSEMSKIGRRMGKKDKGGTSVWACMRGQGLSE